MQPTSHIERYATAGMDLFPANPANKQPIVSQYQATTNIDQLHTWWHTWPDALIAHRPPTDVIILDVDPRHGGADTWDLLLDEIPELDELVTRAHLSGRGDGGLHVWFRIPPGGPTLTTRPLDQWAREHGTGSWTDPTHTRWTSGIDLLRHDHRYTLLPPSTHPDTGRPYQWVGDGPDTPIAPIPVRLLELLTPPAPHNPASVAERKNGHTQPAPTVHVEEGPADWYSKHTRWTDLLPQHGWTLVNGDGNSDGSAWRHPNATNATSATIRHGQLFIHSTATAFEPTSPGDPRGHTPFRAYAILEHHGNLSEAARAVRARMPTPATPAAPPTLHIVDPPQWIQHVTAAAHARRVNPQALIHAVLARTSAYMPHSLHIGRQSGQAQHLGIYTVVYDTTGGGKTRTIATARELVPAPEWITRHEVPLGSGEGIAQLLYGQVQETENDKQITKWRQVHHNAFIVKPEGREFLAIGKRDSSTVFATLCAAWSGEPLGQANASDDRNRQIPAMSYVIGMILGFQPSTVVDFLADAESGTPGRFLWAGTRNPDAADTRTEWPGPLPITWPPAINPGPFDMPMPDQLVDELDQEDLAQHRGQLVLPHLEAQRRARRLKTAAMIAVLDGRWDTGPTMNDWTLAVELDKASTAVRDAVETEVALRAAQKVAAVRQRRSEDAVAASEAVEARRVAECARKIARKVREGRIESTRDARHIMRNYRDVFDDGLEHAVTQGWVIERTEGEQTNHMRRLLESGPNMP